MCVPIHEDRVVHDILGTEWADTNRDMNRDVNDEGVANTSKFLETAADLSATAGSDLAEPAYGLMYSSLEGKICLREKDQILPAGLNTDDIECVIRPPSVFGRIVRDWKLQGLCLLMAESWAWEPSKKPTAKELQTSQQVKDFAICVECLRRFLKGSMNDNSTEDCRPLAITPSIAVDEGCVCCGNNIAFSFLSFFPSSPLFAAPPSQRRRGPQVPPTRPEYQRSRMTAVPNGWLHSPTLRSFTPLGTPHYFVLDNTSISELASVPYEKIRSMDGLVESLLAEVQGFELTAKVEGKEWEAEFKKEKVRKQAEKAAKKGQGMDVAATVVGCAEDGSSDTEEEGSDGQAESDVDMQPPPPKRIRLGPGFKVDMVEPFLVVARWSAPTARTPTVRFLTTPDRLRPFPKSGVMGEVGIEFVEVLGVMGTENADGKYDILDGVTGSELSPGIETERHGMGTRSRLFKPGSPSLFKSSAEGGEVWNHSVSGARYYGYYGWWV
ncbi:uncharacterized protein STEHIDRAFT_113146 [Stereum hirsutum FP-91666 SS1]|uniref:uncharacterized protein n=1 Tax=Stereum hirsutum (strain FP-91666) TaxID=721885 RepID=UPI00044496B7|nr:uncharacterized protein STEHIDRAFT_113146 [Stereum hirsutum FP-91666 SS1]EIM83909.1 hypothetical protein STEHIDRAFT_113146 [Stereum hirsutum FP-91666 SS1]